MFKFDNGFERGIRYLRPPTASNFDADAWKAALAASTGAGLAERRLVETAGWISAQSALGRFKLDTLELEKMNAKWSVSLALAALNREYRTGDLLIKEQLKARADAGDTFMLDEISSMRIMGGADEPVAVADINEVAVDAVESWIYDALNSPGPSDATGDLTKAAIKGLRAYGWRKTLNSLWNDARYLGSYLVKHKGKLLWMPATPDLEKLIAACRNRQEINLLGYPMIDRQAWPMISTPRRRKLGMARSVTAASRSATGVTLKVKTLQYLSKHLPAYVGEKGSMEGSYLTEFLSQSMPSDPRLSPLLVLQAWHVIKDSADALKRITPNPTTFDRSTTLASSLAVSSNVLREAICKALTIDMSTGCALIEFLTYRLRIAESKGHKGLWSAPLVPIPGTDLIALPLTVLHTSNPLRRLEAWLEKGGIDDSNPVDQRGERYEISYRKSICAAVANNGLFKTARCASNGIKKSKTFPEQVDLLVTLGDLALAAEVKFFLTPADAHERSRYFDKLEKAAEQAVRKAAALDSRRDVVATALGIDLTEAQKLEIMPIVVTNQGFAFSMEIGGARIVDAGFLRTYLEDGEMISGMATSKLTNSAAHSRHRFYASETGARRQFAAEMEAPYVLTKFLDRVKFRTSKMPTMAGPSLEMVVPFLGKIEGDELNRAEALIASLAP